MRSLRAGQDHVRCAWPRGGSRRQAHLEALVSHERQTGAPVCSSAPIAPEQRGRADDEWMQKHTHLAGLRGSAAIPLTLLVASGQGRQRRMLAAETTRRLPSASLRRACAESV